MSEYLIGYSKQKITPALPVYLAGYNPVREAAGVHDDIYARVITFSNDNVLHVMVSLDVIAVDHLIYDGIKQSLLNRGITPDGLHIFATHTHSSIAGLCDTESGVLKGTQGILGDTSQTHLDECIQVSTEGILESLDNLYPFTMEIAKGTVAGVGKERHNPDKEGDESLLTIRFNLENGKRILLYNFSCHPTVLNSENKLISADLPYGVEKKVEGYDLILFINGNCGDISTRFTRESSTFDQVDAFGQVIAEAIKKTTDRPYFKGKMNKLKIHELTIPLKVKETDSVEAAQGRLEEIERDIKSALSKVSPGERRVLESRLEGAKTNLLLAENLHGIEEIEFTCSLVQLDGLTFVTFPSEVFSSLTRTLKERYQVGVFAYCNDFNFYLADRNAYEQNYYEALSSPFEKNQGEFLIGEIEKLLQDNK